MGKTYIRKFKLDLEPINPFDVPSGKCPVRQRSGAGAHKRENRETRSERKQECRQMKGKLY